MRTYVIGDIHGCFREFVALLDLCSAHAVGKPARLITLGDYLDRGPDSFRVVRLIRHRLRSAYPRFTSIINLKGNHELMTAQAALGGERSVKETWVRDNGGDATVESYPNIELLRDDAAWLADLPTSCEDELRYYVHAGIRPGVRLKDQNDGDKLWIRNLFLDHKTPHEKYIVHGHTPVLNTDAQENRINLDTASVYGGCLTAAVFEGLQPKPVAILKVKAAGTG